MDFFTKGGFIIGISILLSTISSCQMGGSDYMNEEQRKKLEAAYDSLDTNYSTLIEKYNAGSDSLPVSLNTLYGKIQRMHQQMDLSHEQMMRSNMGRHMQDDRMMGGKMRAHMQGHTTGEWYHQMMGMHEQIAIMHEKLGQQPMAEMNRQLLVEYHKMMRMIPGLDEPTEVPFNAEGDPSLLNGENLYSQNCASCHGSSGQGIADAFPPLVNSDWVTGDKSIPIRILLNGLNGKIEVEGQSYQGTMPAFKARLSAAEIAAILNYLRAESNGNHAKITTQDVIKISKEYSNRVSPWKAEELNED